MKNEIWEEYGVSWEEIGKEILDCGWTCYVEGKGKPRKEAIEHYTETINAEEQAMFMVYVMAKRMEKMEKTLNKLVKALSQNKETTK